MGCQASGTSPKRRSRRTNLSLGHHEMRVLLVGNAGERYFGDRFYIVERKLANGFTRNGHLVHFFSDRDVARNGTLFRSSRAGRGVADARFLEVVRKFRPELIVITHSSLISTSNLGESGRLAYRPRLAQVCVDPLFRAVNVDFLKDRARVVDATFVTTAGAALTQFASATNVSSYIPNPIDASVETARGFERGDQAFDAFFAANAAGDRPDDWRRTAPRLIAETGTVSIDYHGFDGHPPLFGAEYIGRLENSRMGLNINSDRAESANTRAPADQLYLYNSDRISHLMGSGLLTLSFRVNQLMELFEEDREMAFAENPEEMRDVALRFKRDDVRRRQIAEAGWRKSHAHLNERLVARYIEEVTFRRPLSQGYIWPTALW